MLTVYAVYDSKAEAFGSPIFCSTDGLALRGFSDACAAPDSSLHKYPADYVLFKIGTYDPNSGKLTDITPGEHIASASAIVEQLKLASAPQLPEGVKMVSK